MEYKKTAHIFHFIVTILFFPWALVWVLCALRNHQHNAMVDRSRRDEEIAMFRRVVYNKWERLNTQKGQDTLPEYRWNE